VILWYQCTQGKMQRSVVCRIRGRPLFFGGGGGEGMDNFQLKKFLRRKILPKKKSCKGNHGKKIEQVLSTIIIS